MLRKQEVLGKVARRLWKISEFLEEKNEILREKETLRKVGNLEEKRIFLDKQEQQIILGKQESRKLRRKQDI